MTAIVSYDELLDEKYAQVFKSDNTEMKILVFKAMSEITPPEKDEDKLKVLLHIGLAITQEVRREPPELESLIELARKLGEENIYPQIEKYVLEHPLDVNMRFPAFDVTPLIAAACSGLKKTTRLLLEHGADKEACNSVQETASSRCRLMGYSDIADMIDGIQGKVGRNFDAILDPLIE